MKYNKIISFSLATSLLCTALVESVSAPTQCVIVRGTFSPKIVLAAVNTKGKLVEVTKVSAKAKDYVGTDNNHYAANKVGYLSFKTTKLSCSNKDIQNDSMRTFAINNKLDTAKASRMGSAIATLTVLKAPTGTHQESVNHVTEAPGVHHTTANKKPAPGTHHTTTPNNSPTAIALRAKSAAAKAEKIAATKRAKAPRKKLTPAEINALKNSAEAQAKRAQRAAAKAAKQAAADVQKATVAQAHHDASAARAAQAAYKSDVHEEYAEDVEEYEAEDAEETGEEEPTDEETAEAEDEYEDEYEEEEE